MDNIVPLFGRDEMNLVEFPFGPITPTGKNTLEVNHAVWDRKKKREIVRRLIITGSEAFGLPRPVDDRVLIGLKALTYEAGFNDRKVFFSRHHLCRTLGWKPSGKAYQRLEASLDRIAGATLKFKDAWWDKGEQEWRSHTFHLIDNVELCSHDRYQRVRSRTGDTEQSLSFFTWNEVIWKSFSDGNIKKLDMEMFRRISQGKKREVAVRLYRVLDKRFYQKRVQAFCVQSLGAGILGLSSSFVSKLKPTIAKAADVLVECGFLESFRFRNGKNGNAEALFVRKPSGLPRAKDSSRTSTKQSHERTPAEAEPAILLLDSFSDQELFDIESTALRAGFGTSLERKRVQDERKGGKSVGESGFTRRLFVDRFLRDRAKDSAA